MLNLKTSILIPTSAKNVWEALTNPELIAQYFFGTNCQCDWEKGSAITFSGEFNGISYLDKGTILSIEKYKHIEYDYFSSFSGLEDLPENYKIIRYELNEVNGQTEFTVSQNNFETEEARSHSESSWGMIMEGLSRVATENG